MNLRHRTARCDPSVRRAQAVHHQNAELRRCSYQWPRQLPRTNCLRTNCLRKTTAFQADTVDFTIGKQSTSHHSLIFRPNVAKYKQSCSLRLWQSQHSETTDSNLFLGLPNV